jgi:hypothetical protein
MCAVVVLINKHCKKIYALVSVHSGRTNGFLIQGSWQYIARTGLFEGLIPAVHSHSAKRGTGNVKWTASINMLSNLVKSTIFRSPCISSPVSCPEVKRQATRFNKSANGWVLLFSTMDIPLK